MEDRREGGMRDAGQCSQAWRLGQSHENWHGICSGGIAETWRHSPLGMENVSASGMKDVRTLGMKIVGSLAKINENIPCIFTVTMIFCPQMINESSTSRWLSMKLKSRICRPQRCKVV